MWTTRPLPALALCAAQLVSACSTQAPPVPVERSRPRDAAVAREPAPAPAQLEWQQVDRGQLADVRVERALYERAGDTHFYVHIDVRNVASRPIGVDLRATDWAVVYPNQWGGLPGPRREVIDEARTRPRRVDEQLSASLRAAFRAGDLTRLEPGGSVAYYRLFNASDRTSVSADRSPFVFVSLGGQLLVTDGEREESLEPADPGNADLVLSTPIRWRTVDANALVVAER